MKRLAQTVRLVPGRRAEYLALHAAVWPAVEAALHAAHVTNYSIFVHGDTLFGYMEYTGETFEADMATIALDTETRRWWELTSPCLEPFPDSGTGGTWSDMAEIWHLSETGPA
jgi:L-rhamnose mutarotase